MAEYVYNATSICYANDEGVQLSELLVLSLRNIILSSRLLGKLI